MALVARAWPRRLRRRPEDEVEVSRSGRTNRKTLWGNWQQQFLPENRMACYKSFDTAVWSRRERGKEANAKRFGPKIGVSY
jgi:hypothetical protein